MGFYINPEILLDMQNEDNLVTIKKSKSYLLKKFREYEIDCEYGGKVFNPQVGTWVTDLLNLESSAFTNIPSEILDYIG